VLGLDVGRYYAFNVDGPTGDGEAFNPDAAVGDPYAVATAHAEHNPMVLDRDATNQWFGGWTDDTWKPPAMQDVVIYETHVRDLTAHSSSGVDPDLRGTYAGVVASEGTGTGLDYLKDLGVNMLEFLPVNEFNNGTNDYNWGYSTVYYFAPEASYGRDPNKGSQYYEFKHLVNELHERGFGVILDVVYNHVGSPNVFSLIDKKYFFRLNPDYTYSNFSGVGNDVRSESLMMRRYIVDNIVYWMEEFHIDGFRFDLAELIDLETLMAVRDAARAINPDVLLISEPWSFRGEHKSQLKGTGWSAWNNDFRYAAKDFVRGHGDRNGLAKSIAGSVETWAANPLQPVNYVESHDDKAVTDELAESGNGWTPTETLARRSRLAGTILFTSLGIPMIAEGQEFLRSKNGVSNTYNKGDKLNAIRWGDRERPIARTTQAYYQGLIGLRKSEAGASFRVAQRPPDDYYRWIWPDNPKALGYMVNVDRVHAGRAFVVLVNGADAPVDFEVPLPPGNWRMIANGTTLDPGGLADKPAMSGGQTLRIRIPAIRSAILMDGF
jgi:pullulanase/glycogen debranching enzyme